jgi:hypothetical protein
MTIKVPSDLRCLFETNRSDFNDALAAQLTKHLGSLCALLHPWRSNPRATIATVDIEELQVEDDGTGVVHCMYVEEVYMGCKEMDSEEERWDSLGFTYLRDQDEVCFQETTPLERNTLDEF